MPEKIFKWKFLADNGNSGTGARWEDIREIWTQKTSLKQNLKPSLQEIWLSSEEDPKIERQSTQVGASRSPLPGGTWNDWEASQGSSEPPDLRLSLSIHHTTLLSRLITSFLRARTMLPNPMFPVPSTWLGLWNKINLGNISVLQAEDKTQNRKWALTGNELSFFKVLKTDIYTQSSITPLLPGHPPTRSQTVAPGMGDTTVESYTPKEDDGSPKTCGSSNPTSREVGPALSYLGGCWGFCIGRLDKERNPAPLPVIKDHLPHSSQVRLSTLKRCRKMSNSNHKAASRFTGTSLSQLSVTTWLPRVIFHTAHTHVPKKKGPQHTSRTQAWSRSQCEFSQTLAHL